METTVVFAVLLGALLHASWNALVKSDSSDRLVTLAVVMSVGSVIGLFFVPFVAIPKAGAWPWLMVRFASGCLAAW